MQSQGEASPREFRGVIGGKFRRKLSTGSSSPARTISAHKVFKRPQQLRNVACGISTLEQLISEQNILIERLRKELKHEKSTIQSLKNQSLSATKADEELNKLKDLLLNNGIKEVSQKSFDVFKTNIEQELSRSFSKTIHDLNLNHQKEIERLELRHQEEISSVRERSNFDNNHLANEIKALSDSLSHFKETTLGNIGDTPSHNEIGLLSSSLSKLNTLSLELSPLMSNISNFLVQSIEREISLRKELISCKTTSTFTDNYEKCHSDVSKIDESKFVQIEHSLNVCNHDKERCRSLGDQRVSSKLEYILGDSKQCTLNVPAEMETLLSYTSKLKKYIKDMVNFYNCRLNKLIKSESDIICMGWSSGNDEIPLKKESTLSQSEKLMRDTKECHKMIFCLNEILKSLDHNLDESLKKNKHLDEEMIKQKQSHMEKVFSLESHVKLLNEKIIICLRENKTLESTLSDLRGRTVSKDQFDLLIEEKDKLVDVVTKLEEEVESLKGINVKLENLNKNMQGDSCLMDRTKAVCKDETVTFSDGSINYESLLPMNAITSTPYPTKMFKSEAQANHELLKSSLMEWIERCQALESEKKQLERKLFNLNFTFNQASLGKTILEQELDIVKDNMKILEGKLTDYISLKETCHILENDNSVLNIKNKFLTDIINNSKGEHMSECVPDDISQMDYKFYKSLEPNLFDSTYSAFNFINELQKKNQKLILLESQCRAKDSMMGELTIKLNQAKEIETLLESKIDGLINDNNKMNEKLFSLIDENAQVIFDKKLLNIELKSVKDQLNYLISCGDTFKDSSSSELIEAMKNDALKFLKESIDKWSKVELRSVEISPAQIDRLDARHQVEILIKSNNQFKNDKEELLKEIMQFQHEFHVLQKQRDCVDASWYVRIDKYETDLVKELKEQREQHARIEEALRSTGKLHDDMQKQLNIHRVKLKEISSLQKKLEDEKHRNKCSEAQIVLLETELKDKEKMLLETIEDKKAYENKITSLEKEFAHKEKIQQSHLLRTKWASQFNQNKYSDLKVKKDLANFQNEVFLQENEKEKSRFASMEAIYQHSIDSLRYCMEQDKAQSLARTSEKHQAKLKEYVQVLKELYSRVEDLESCKVLKSLGVVVENEDEHKLSQIQANKEKLFKELFELESEEASAKDVNLFSLLKSKLQEYYDQQFYLSITYLKEKLKSQNEIKFEALNELHQEEMTLLKLKMDADKNSELHTLSQDQLKREKNLINSLTQSDGNGQSSVFRNFKISVIRMFLRYIQMFIPSWEKHFYNDLDALEKRYQECLENYNELDDNIEAEIIDKLENIIHNHSSVVDNSKNFVIALEECLSNILKNTEDFIKHASTELSSTVAVMTSKDCPENIAALENQIKTLQKEKDELNEKHLAAVQLLTSDHKEELLKIRSLIDGMNKENTVSQDTVLDDLRAELEAKHVSEVDDLRKYFEQKFAEFEKNYSEEILSHHSCKMSMSSTSSEAELVSEVNSIEPPFVATWIVTGDPIGGNADGYDLVSELYSDKDVEKGLLVERYFVDFNAMDKVLLKHKYIVDKMDSDWRERMRALYADLEKNYSERLQIEMRKLIKNEEKVNEILTDVKKECVKEIEWINAVRNAAVFERSLKTDLERHYENEISKLEDEFENRLIKETETLLQTHKMREMEAVWAAQVEAEQSYREEIQTVRTEWEKKYVADMASLVSERTIQKVQFEEEVKKMIKSFDSIFSKQHQSAVEKLNLHVSKLDDLQEKLAELADHQSELVKTCNVEKEVMQKNCNNIINKAKMDAKHSCDLLISMYEKELAQLAETHQEEMKVMLEKHKEEMSCVKENIMQSPAPDVEELNKRARDLAVKDLMEYIKNIILEEERSGKGETVITLPPEFSYLEQFLKNRLNKVLDKQALKHSEDLDNLRQHFLTKFENYTKISDDDKDSDSSKSICQNCGPGGSQEIEKLMKERDALKTLSDTLKNAVGQLTTYLHSCEDEVNKTVVEQLIRAAVSVENSPVRQGSGHRRVHFAPDVSKILEESTMNESTLYDISLNDPDISTKLKQELDSCLSKLKKEAANILGLSVADKTTQRYISIPSTLSDMARNLLADKSPPSAEIMNVIEELTLEGDRLIEQLHIEKEDLQQQILAADNQLRSTRKFLEDQAVEREAERDEYSRELSLLQAHIKQTTPDTRNQTLTMQVEDLEKQVKDTTNSLDDAETRKKELETELKSTVEKVWVLTDIINKLESQLMVKSEREECLEKRLDELEAELEHQSIAQQAMVQEMESLKSKEESEGNYMEQIAALQEEMKLQYSSNSIRNIKAQLRELEKVVENRTKELEGLNLTSSTTSLSSPSEEISIREHLEMMRCHTPEFCPSPVALPIDEVNKLQDKIHRHIRSEEMIIKRVNDQDLQIKKLSCILGEVQAEREVLQQTVDKLNVQLGRANTKVDDLRRKAETAHSAANQALSEKIAHLEQQVAHFKQSLDLAQTQLQQKEEQINRAKELIDEQSTKLRNVSQASPEIVQALRLELSSVMTEKNKLEELVEKYKNEAEALDMSPLYNCLLNDKNEDIQQLQRTVSYLQSQQAAQSTKSGSGDFTQSLVGKTVSFADELSPIGRAPSPCRDAPKNAASYTFHLQPYEMDKGVSLGNVSEIHPIPVAEPLISPSSSSLNMNPAFLRNESSTGDEKINKLESEVKSLRSLVADLTDAKKDVESYISSFTDDRKYYESQLNKLLDEKKSQEDEIDKLRQTLDKKDNEIKSTTADVTKLQVILSNLQEKLKQASKFATKDNELKKELSEMKEKCSTLEEVLEGFYKFREELGSINEEFKYRENTDDYFQNILVALRQKLRKNTDIELSNSNLKRQNDDLRNEIFKLKKDNQDLIDEVTCKKQEFTNELTLLKSEMDEINQNNYKLKNDIANYLQLKQENIDMISKIEQLELCKNLMEVELNSLKSENNKLTEELECIQTELKFKTINNNYDDVGNEKDAVDSVSLPHETEPVADLEDLTYEIEKQLDLSAKLDNSLLNTIGDKSYYKKEPSMSAAASSHLKETGVGGRVLDGGQQGLFNWLAKEVNAWQTAGSKQNQLASQFNNLSRLVQSQDNRITRLLVELDGKKKECLVMELDLLRERSNLKQVQCLLETERQRARSIQKEDTHLIETLRIRLEAALKAESSLKSLLLEEKQKNESLEACLNSARALESYIQASSSDSESNQAVRNQLLLRIEVDRLKQMNSDLEHVISRERNYQASLKDKLKLLQFQNQSSEKLAEDLKVKLNQEMKLRESVENQLRTMGRNNTPSKVDNDVGSKLAMESVLTEIKQWKDECMQLRECIRLQREHEDYWTANVQTPLIKQLNDVNRSLETLVREKITLQTYVNCIEKERDFLRNRVEKLEEMNEKLSNTHLHLSPQMSSKLNLQSVFNKLQYLAELNHKMESHRKALIWQKRYLLIAINGYQRTAAETINRIDPLSSNIQSNKRVSFRAVVHVISACIKLNYIHRRRKASRKVMVNRMKAEINLPSPLNLRKSTVDILGSNNNCMSLSPPSRDLYAIPRIGEASGPSSDSEPSKLSQYIAMFDQMQKRLGKIIQNENT